MTDVMLENKTSKTDVISSITHHRHHLETEINTSTSQTRSVYNLKKFNIGREVTLVGFNTFIWEVTLICLEMLKLFEKKETNTYISLCMEECLETDLGDKS